MLDINNKKIRIGCKVMTRQYSNGILPPSSPKIGIVEKTKNGFGKTALQVRCKNEGVDFFILLEGKINKII